MKGLKVTAEYTFLKTNSGATNVISDNMYWDVTNDAPYIIDGRGRSELESSYKQTYSKTDYHALNLYVGYENKIKDHDFRLLAGTNQELSKYNSFWAKRLSLINVNYPTLSTASGTMTNDDSFSDYSISGYFARLNYGYKNKYLLEANVRYDGSSKFPKSWRYGFFPSFSGGWVLTEEPFMKPAENIISFMKIRGSWGEIGNQAISNYAYIPGMGSENAAWIDPSTAIRYLTLKDPALVSASFTWETVRTRDIGIDMNLLNNRLNTTFDYFNRQTLDMLGPALELPAVIGASAPLKNVADLESKGWELSIEWKVNKPDFGYSLGINLSDNRAFVTKFKNEGGLLSQYYEGYEFGEIWGYETYGYYSVDDFESGSLDANLMNGTLKEGIPAYYTVVRQNPGDIRFADLNDDKKISPGTSTLSDPGDRKIVGNSNRRYQYGITGTCYYKNLDFSFFFQGVGKRDLWTNSLIYWPYSNQYVSLYDWGLDYWTPENTNGFFPRNYTAAGGNTGISRLPQTKYLLNGAYMMLKNIELGYSLPKNVLNRLSIDRLRLFVSAENLLKFDHLPAGIDTEAEDINSYGGIYPYLRKISFGVNVSF